MFVWTRGRMLLTAGVVINAIILVSWLAVSHYLANTDVVPAFGGRYIEGAVGHPVNLSPIVAITDVDKDLSRLIFSGLTRIDAEGKLVGDLAKDWTIDEANLVYTFNLRDDVTWHDGVAFTAEDVAFTIRLIQDEAFPGAFGLKEEWKGVVVEVVDNLTIKLTLPDPYAPFIGSTTLGIVPKHKLESVPVAEAINTPFNQEPVGTGMYRFESFTSKETAILAVDLVAYTGYFAGLPYIEAFTMRFFDTENALVDAVKKHEVLGVRAVTSSQWEAVSELRNLDIQRTQLPQYQAVFINLQRNPVLWDSRVRAALWLSVDRQQLVDTILLGHGTVVDGPLLRSSWAYTESTVPLYDIERANQYLEEAGWILNAETGIRMQGETPLSFTLVSDDDPDRRRTAFELATMWEKIGVQTDVRLFGVGTFVEVYLQGREFDLALFGQNVSWDPDVYAFWHSSQVSDPGLNLSRLADDKIDKLLQDARRISDLQVRKEKYAAFQQQMRDIKPAIFLYSPTYDYAVSGTVKNVSVGFMATAGDRFATLPSWYIETRRVKAIADEAPAELDIEEVIEEEQQILLKPESAEPEPEAEPAPEPEPQTTEPEATPAP